MPAHFDVIDFAIWIQQKALKEDVRPFTDNNHKQRQKCRNPSSWCGNNFRKAVQSQKTVQEEQVI